MEATAFNSYVGSGVWITVYSVVICAAVAGNVLTLLAIISSRQLSAMMSNQFIFSLAASDLLVGLSVPYHMCFYLTDSFGNKKDACVVRFVLISFACASSILNLFVVAADRYSAIVHPLRYNRYMTRTTSLVIISLTWIFSLTMTTVLIYWNSWTPDDCDVKIIPSVYFTFVLLPLFVLIWGVMLLVYIRIWREAAKHAERIRSTTNHQHSHYFKDTKSIQVVMMTLGCFSVCWMPYFIVTTYYRVTGFSIKNSLSYEIAFTLAVCNSGMNPMIYAWKNSNFRKAFLCLLTCKSPNAATKKTSFITNHVPSSKRNSTATNGVDNVAAQTEIHVEMDGQKRKDYDEHECSVSTEVTTVNNS